MTTERRNSSRPVLFLIDGNSQVYRAYHAIRGLTGPDGRSTGAVYGFVAMLRKLVTDQRPDLVACAFDLAGPTFRSEMAADYKANRPPMPDDLVAQIPYVHRACEALGVPILSCEGFEADDVIGTVAERAVREGYQVAIVTGDKDMFQLVGDGVRVFNPRDDGTWYDAEGVREKFGVPPEFVVDVLALMGDAVDNIKGVPGVGEKGARDLITTFGSLDALLARAGEVQQKKYRESLLAHAELAHQSRELARIRRDAPLQFDVPSFRYQGPNQQACFELFGELGFRSLLNEFAPTTDTVTKDYAIVDDIEAVRALATELRAAGRFALRTLTTAGPLVRADLVGVAVTTGHRRARYIPLAHHALDAGPQPDRRAAIEALRPLLEDPQVGKVGHDLKLDAIALARYGVTLRGLSFDTMLASYLLDATRSSHPIEQCALDHLQYRAIAEEDVLGRGARALGMDELPPAAVLDFAGERADLGLRRVDHVAAGLGVLAVGKCVADRPDAAADPVARLDDGDVGSVVRQVVRG